MNNSRERLTALYNTIGLNTADGTINSAEIAGYCAALDMLANETDVAIDTENICVPIEYSSSNFLRDTDGVFSTYSISNGVVEFYDVQDNFLIGRVCAAWFCPFYTIELDGGGITWHDINKTWRWMESLGYTWNMIESVRT